MFRNDYSDICASEVLDAIRAHINEQNYGYGTDGYSKEASELIQKEFGLLGNADVHFLEGGTQANMTVISYFLRPYEAVIACDTGHINVHETGAVEGSGHKVLTRKNEEGKLLAKDIEAICKEHRDEHMVKPKMVYISDTTETGTVYTKAELLSIRKACDKYNLLLFLDGARLGVALTCEGADVDAKFLGKVCDIFYVGGTKNGGLFGEAVVIKNSVGAKDFRYHIKNRGAMLAKGFILGIQFKEMFKDGLYYRLAKNSNDTAKIIRENIIKIGIPLVGKSNTNQIFIRVKSSLVPVLEERYGTELWSIEGEFSVVRIVTSFSTKTEEVNELVEFLRTL